MLKRLTSTRFLSISSFYMRYYANDVRFGTEARSLLLKGVDIMADAVGATMGPKGRNAIIEQIFDSPTITKGGIAVADAVLNLHDRQKNLGAKLVRDAANNANNEVGDGTTTATILTRAIAKEGFQLIKAGVNPLEMRKGILMAVEKTCEELKRMSKPVMSTDQIAQVARISANGDEGVAKLIREAVKKLGRDGFYVVKEGTSIHDEIEIQKGIKFDEGYMSPYFVNTTKGNSVIYRNALLLLMFSEITSLESLLPALKLAYKNERPLVIVADKIENDAMSTLVLNRVQQDLQVCAVKAPSFGNSRKEIMNDIAVVTGGMLFDDECCFEPLEKVTLNNLGQVGDVVITKNSTLFMNGGGNPLNIANRVMHIREQLRVASTNTERDQLNERLARLISGIAVLRVGGASDLEIKEKKDRINNALNAMRAAIREGVVPGGGIAYLRCIPKLLLLKGDNKDQDYGISLVCDALRLPCITIAKNAGVNGSVVVANVMEHADDYGYDAMKNEYAPLIARGIIDSTTVVRKAITDAAGIASMLITAEAVITDIPTKPIIPRPSHLAIKDIGRMLGM